MLSGAMTPQVGGELKEKPWREVNEEIQGERGDWRHVDEGNRGEEEVMKTFGVQNRNAEGETVVDLLKEKKCQ